MENKLLLKTKNAHTPTDTHTKQDASFSCCLLVVVVWGNNPLHPSLHHLLTHEDEAIKMRPFASHFSLALMNFYFHHILEPVCHCACLIRGGKVNPKGWLFLFWLKWAFFSPPKELLFLQWSFIFPQSVLISRRSTVMNTATGDG